MKNIIIALILLSFAVLNAAPMRVVSELFTANPNCWNLEDWARLALRTLMDENENLIPIWWDMQDGMQSPGAAERFEQNGGEEVPMALFGGRSELIGWQCNYEEYLELYNGIQGQQSAVAIDLQFSEESPNSFEVTANVSMENNLFTEDNKIFFIVTSDTVRIDVSASREGEDRADSEWSYRVLAISDLIDFDLAIAGESATYNHTFEIPELEFVDVEDYQAIAIIQGLFDGKMVQAERVGLGSTSSGLDEINQTKISLSNYPNPFNPETKISYQINDSDFFEKTQIDIYNIKGELVKCYPHINSQKGSVVWDGKDQTGLVVSSGVYFYKLQVGGISYTKKMILMK